MRDHHMIVLCNVTKIHISCNVVIMIPCLGYLIIEYISKTVRWVKYPFSVYKEQVAGMFLLGKIRIIIKTKVLFTQAPR